MDILTRHLAFVKEQEAYHEKLSRRFEGQPWRRDLHLRTAENFRALANDMTQAGSQVGLRRRQVIENLALTPEDVDGLPQELVSELSISEADKLEFVVLGAIKEAGGILNLDRILIALFRKTGEVYKRNVITSKLYRMIQKGLIFPVGTRKGVYSTDEVDISEAPDLLSSVAATDGAHQLTAANTRPTAATPDARAPRP